MLRALPSPSSGALRDGNQGAISQISGGLKDGSTSHTHPASQSTNPEPQKHKDQWDQGVWESHRSSVFLSPALCAPQVPSTARNIHGTGIKLKIPARKTILNSSSDVALLNKKSRRNHSTSQADSQHERDEGVPPPPIPNDTDKETGKSRRIQRFFSSIRSKPAQSQEKQGAVKTRCAKNVTALPTLEAFLGRAGNFQIQLFDLGIVLLPGSVGKRGREQQVKDALKVSFPRFSKDKVKK